MKMGCVSTYGNSFMGSDAGVCMSFQTLIRGIFADNHKIKNETIAALWIRNSLRNWRILKYGSCGRFSMAFVTACSPFGIMILRRNGKD